MSIPTTIRCCWVINTHENMDELEFAKYANIRWFNDPMQPAMNITTIQALRDLYSQDYLICAAVLR